VVDELASFGAARDVVIVSFLLGLSRIGSLLVDSTADASEIEFAFPEPPYFARLAPTLANRVRFSQPANRIVFDAAVLDRQIVLADASAFRLAVERCQRDLDALGAADHVVSRTRSMLPRTDNGFHSIRQVASEMGVSVRTLKRHLAARGTTFSTLLRELREERATLLLRSDLSIKEIASKLGYADQAGFTRAFRRWWGTSPRAFRRQARQPAPRGLRPAKVVPAVS
jgi:AraC-like DNA-binding protein